MRNYFRSKKAIGNIKKRPIQIPTKSAYDSLETRKLMASVTYGFSGLWTLDGNQLTNLFTNGATTICFEGDNGNAPGVNTNDTIVLDFSLSGVPAALDNLNVIFRGYDQVAQGGDRMLVIGNNSLDADYVPRNTGNETPQNAPTGLTKFSVLGTGQLNCTIREVESLGFDTINNFRVFNTTDKFSENLVFNNYLSSQNATQLTGTTTAGIPFPMGGDTTPIVPMDFRSIGQAGGGFLFDGVQRPNFAGNVSTYTFNGSMSGSDYYRFETDYFSSSSVFMNRVLVNTDSIDVPRNVVFLSNSLSLSIQLEANLSAFPSPQQYAVATNTTSNPKRSSFRDVTQTGSQNLFVIENLKVVEYRGGAANDIFYAVGFSGTATSTRIYGNGGDDIVYGSHGPDTIYGGTGNDVLHGYTGNDSLFGDAGNDELNGNFGDDKLYGGAGSDTLRGGEGNDDLYGGSLDFVNGVHTDNDVDNFDVFGNSGLRDIFRLSTQIGATTPVEVKRYQTLSSGVPVVPVNLLETDRVFVGNTPAQDFLGLWNLSTSEADDVSVPGNVGSKIRGHVALSTAIVPLPNWTKS